MTINFVICFCTSDARSSVSVAFCILLRNVEKITVGEGGTGVSGEGIERVSRVTVNTHFLFVYL